MRKTVDFKGQSIHYTHLQSRHKDNRTAPLTVMLVHGFPERGSIFQAQAAALSEHYALLIVDLPGSGDSAFNPALGTLGDYAEGLASIIEAAQVARLVIIGHSMGGYIALGFAEKYPEKLCGLGLLHSTAYSDTAEKKTNRLKAIETMQRFGGPAFLKSMIPALFGNTFKASHPEVIDELIRSGSHFETKALQQYYRMMHDRTDKTAVLRNLPVPFLFVSGTEDKAAPAADLIAQATLPDTAQIEILDQAGHMGFMEQPDRTNRALIEFLSLIDHLGG